MYGYTQKTDTSYSTLNIWRGKVYLHQVKLISHHDQFALVVVFISRWRREIGPGFRAAIPSSRFSFVSRTTE